ncbi:choline BCCT transporter BetT [Kineococcus arenarius]|uniref:choline BCCT transporter BetT n=1 Tax=unclassified Kineococcus TaxID=2621656 RepID=UPI003D7CB5FD
MSTPGTTPAGDSPDGTGPRGGASDGSTAVQPPGGAGAGPAGREARVQAPVFWGAAIAVLALAGWILLAPESASSVISTAVGWVGQWFGWYYVLFATVVLVFVVVLALSRYGRTKLGPEHSSPQFSTFAWVSMLFAAGIGTDLMFFAVAEPVTQFLQPPVGQGGTVAAAREATVWTMFHYGISGWGMYALMGMALGYFSYRMNLPLAIRSALYPVFGRRVHGALGHGVDIAAMLGTIFGVATSLGIAVVQLNFGLFVLFGVPEGPAAQIGLIALAVVLATISAVTGVDRGIKLLSQLNVLLAAGLVLFVLVAGNTTLLLNGLVMNVGDFASGFGSLTMETFAWTNPQDWMNGWTLFFWAWWAAWAAFVGMFLARISRGRTIRQFVLGSLTIPFAYIVMWVSIFGNSAIDAVRRGGSDFGELTVNTPERGFYTLLMEYPAFTFVAGLATVIGLLFYVTSADSGALVMANLSSRLPTPNTDAGTGLRVFWALVTGLLTVGMLLVGGVTALQSATVVMGLPFTFVMLLVMVGLYKALRVEGLRDVSRVSSLPGRLSGRSPGVPERRDGDSWRLRLGRAMGYPSRDAAQRHLDEVVLPALREVAGEMRERGVDAEVGWTTDAFGDRYAQLAADLGQVQPFCYRVHRAELPVPVFARDDRRRSGDDREQAYSRLEVHLAEGGQGYDVMGYTHSQLIDDVLDQYERHVEWLRLQQDSTRQAN